MFIMNYTEGKGWHDPRVIPFENLSLSPAAMVFHYGQEMFEGLKAYKTEDGRTLLFRPEMNARRANNTNKRLCIPEIIEEDFVQAIETVVKVDEDWILQHQALLFIYNHSLLLQTNFRCKSI